MRLKQREMAPIYREKCKKTIEMLEAEENNVTSAKVSELSGVPLSFLRTDQYCKYLFRKSYEEYIERTRLF